MKRVIWFFFLLLLSGQLLAAQSLAEAHLNPGTRLCVTAPSVRQGRVVGTLVTLDTETLTLALAEKGRPHVSTPLTSITLVEVGRGRRRGQSALLGGGVGFLTLGLVGALSLSGDDCTQGGFCLFSDRDARILGFVGGGMLGFVAGSLVGIAFAPTRWQPLPGSPRMSIAPTGELSLTLVLH